VSLYLFCSDHIGYPAKKFLSCVCCVSFWCLHLCLKLQNIDMACSLSLEFRGGAELLFGGVKDHQVMLPESDTKWTVRDLLVWIRDNLLQQRTDMFMQGTTVRPGILVLINNTDWELCGQLNYCLSDNDTVLFISTLHGG